METYSKCALWLISIHAPREGGDYPVQTRQKRYCISIHAPREGGDLALGMLTACGKTFQSTPPARGAT